MIDSFALGECEGANRVGLLANPRLTFLTAVSRTMLIGK